MERRILLTSASLAGVAGLRACSSSRAPAPSAAPSPAAFDPRDWTSVRRQFSVDPAVAHLSAFVLAPHPAPVRAAIDTHRTGLDRDPLTYLHSNQQRLETAVASAASEYLGAPATQIAFTDSTTMGIGLVYGGLKLKPGDEVLTTEHDFAATYEALRLRASRSGVKVRRVRLYDDPSAARVSSIVDAIVTAVSSKTRAVAITWVHSSTGVRLPVAEIAAALKARRPDVLLCVDGVHGFAAVDATAQKNHQAIGRDRITARITELATALKDGIAGISGIRLITPRDPALSAGIVCCDIPGNHPASLASLLAASKVIASVTPYDPPYLRFGPTMLNTPEDIEATLRALRAIAP